VLTIYLASALLGGCVLAGSWFLGHDHPTDVETDHHDGESTGPHAGPLGTLLKLRFWTFGLTFFGLAGVVLQVLGSEEIRRLTPLLSGLFGATSGFTAARLIDHLLRSSPGALDSASSHVGREGRLLLPASPGQRGKVRLDLPSGASLDLIAEAQDGDELPLGAKVLVLEIRDTVAIVARSPLDKGKP
jgi:hypothetical protein